MTEQSTTEYYQGGQPQILQWNNQPVKIFGVELALVIENMKNDENNMKHHIVNT